MTDTNTSERGQVKKYRVKISYALESVTGYEIFAMSEEDAAAIGKHRFLTELRNPENYKNVQATAKEEK